MLWRKFGPFGISGLRDFGISGSREFGSSGVHGFSNSRLREFGNSKFEEWGLELHSQILLRTTTWLCTLLSLAWLSHACCVNITPTSLPEKTDCHLFGTPQVCRATATRKLFETTLLGLPELAALHFGGPLELYLQATLARTMGFEEHEHDQSDATDAHSLCMC